MKVGHRELLWMRKLFRFLIPTLRFWFLLQLRFLVALIVELLEVGVRNSLEGVECWILLQLQHERLWVLSILQNLLQFFKLRLSCSQFLHHFNLLLLGGRLPGFRFRCFYLLLILDMHLIEHLLHDLVGQLLGPLTLHEVHYNMMGGWNAEHLVTLR